MRLTFGVLLSLSVVVSPEVAGQRTRDPLAGLDAYVTRVMSDWGVPGASVAIVRGDSVLVARGYGVRKLGEAARVDAETIFPIGSNSKAFTSAALALLVDEGKLRWSDPVIDHLPWFRVLDPWITRRLDIGDLLSHRTGLARHDALWYATGRSTRDVVERLRFVDVERPFRTSWLYNNNLYLTAGQVIEELSGQNWDDFVAARLLRPLGMRHASTTVRGLDQAPNAATPHMELDGTLVPVAYRNIDNAGPAGSINASALDMAQWLRFQIDSGRIGGRRLLEPRQFTEMWRGVAVIDDPMFRRLMAPSELVEYGLGWFLYLHRDRRVVMHGGNIDGMSALVSFIPSERIGVVVLTNLNQTFAHAGLTRWIFDRLLGAPEEDWSARTREALQAGGGGGGGDRWRSARVEGTKPSLPLAGYAGTYADSLYGSVSIREQGGRLVLDMDPGHQAELEHWHYDTFRARYQDRTMNAGSNFVTFTLGGDGAVASVKVESFTTFGRVRRAR